MRTMIEKVFSAIVFGEIFPNPTVVKLVKIKYKALTYSSEYEGPPTVVMLCLLYGFST